jgi:outer membrane receptor protein involved in Fe transport
MTLNRFAFIVLIVLLISLPGYSIEKKEENPSGKKEKKEQEYYEVKKVEEVVVTATMTPRPLKDCASTVNVVNNEDIDLLSAASVLTVLNYTPGIFVNRSGDFGRADVDIRGLGQNCRRVAVLVDGKPEKMGLYGCAVSHAFPLDNVERVEVVKGPASVLYGGEALGGAINIITHIPKEKFETSLTAFYGSYNTRQFNLRHGGNLECFKYFLTFDKRDSDGHIENAGYSGYSVTGKVVYDIAEHTRLNLQAKYFDGEKFEPGTVDNPLTDFWNDYKRGAVDLTLTREWEKNELSIKLYRNFGKHVFSDGWDSRDYTNGAAVRFTTRGIVGNELTMGGDIRFFGGKSFGYPVGEWDKNEGSLFIQEQYTLADRWIFSGGLRVQFDSLYGSELCPQFGLVFHASGNTLFRGTVSKGFRSPQLNELYMYPSANTELEPERVRNYELGFELTFGGRVTVKGSLFHMKGTNLIRTVPNSAPPLLYIFANTGEFSFYGIEAEVEALIGRYLFGSIAYSLMDTGDLTKGRPGQKIDAALRFKNKHFATSFQGQYVTDYYAADFSENRIPSYFLLNARVSVSLLKNLELLVDVNNIFDKQYSIYGEFPGLTAGLYRMPGRNIQVGIRFRP